MTPKVKKEIIDIPIESKPTVEKSIPKLEDLEGVGPVRLKKLYANGIFTINDLLIRGEESLARTLEIPYEDAKEMTFTAQEALGGGIDVMASMTISGDEFHKNMVEKIRYLTTGHEELDEITGGYESSAITEFFGLFGSGKTQFMTVACAMAQMPINPCCFDCGNDMTPPPTEFKPTDFRYVPPKIEKKCSKCESERIWKGGGLSEYGKPCRVIYIDTENSFRPKRLYEIIVNRDLVKTKPQTKTEEKTGVTKEPIHEDEYLKAKEMVDNVDRVHPLTSALQTYLGNNLTSMIDGDFCKKCKKRVIDSNGLPTHKNHPRAKSDMVLEEHDFEQNKPAKLVIIDSITGKFRSEFEGRGTLSDRQMKIKTHVHIIEGSIEGKNVVCLVTNQVGEKMDLAGSHADPIRPVGGNEIGHIFKTRIYLKKPQALNKDKITVILIDSPNKAKNEINIELGPKGIQEIAE